VTTEHDKQSGTVNIEVRESGSTEQVDEKHDEESCEHVHWETGFWKRFPWIGAIAIFTMLVCIAMDGLILGTSDQKFREEWPAHQRWNILSDYWKSKTQIEPHVLLAIVNTVTNVALAIAIGHGVAIAWWRRVLMGSTIEVSRAVLLKGPVLTFPGSPPIMGLCFFGSRAPYGRQAVQLHCSGSVDGKGSSNR
jgi:hypothetical protein